MSSNRMVGALLFKDGRVLLGHRTETRAELAGVWDMVGGHVEQNESLAGALRSSDISRLASGKVASGCASSRCALSRGRSRVRAGVCALGAGTGR
jgi:8-oxo-dGTP pyrophosphatase MutT (NUDIX family)